MFEKLSSERVTPDNRSGRTQQYACGGDADRVWVASARPSTTTRPRCTTLPGTALSGWSARADTVPRSTFSNRNMEGARLPGRSTAPCTAGSAKRGIYEEVTRELLAAGADIPKPDRPLEATEGVPIIQSAEQQRTAERRTAKTSGESPQSHKNHSLCERPSQGRRLLPKAFWHEAIAF